MTQDTTSYIEMLRKFGSDLGLPKLDVDKLIEAQKKNIDALSESARVAAQGAQSVAQKQREVLEAGLREATTLAADTSRSANYRTTSLCRPSLPRKSLKLPSRERRRARQPQGNRPARQ